MKRQLGKLTAIAVSKKTKMGYYGDGGGLWLQVSQTGTKSWLFRFTLAGKAREMGLGPLHTVSLADARIKAADGRKLLVNGIDPIQARDAERTRQALEAARSKTFSECAAAYIAAHRAGWKNAKHAAQWESTLETYCAPTIGALPVQDIDTTLVTKVLESIWTEKPETASRLRGRIESVLDWATVRGYRGGDNPARWRGHLDSLLPALKKRLRVKHHAALPFDQMGEFIAKVRAEKGIAARALEFLILTAARTSEVIGARWSEIDLTKASWTIPASRMKAGDVHCIPLSPRAVKIIRTLEATRQSDYIFPGQREGKPLSNMAMLKLLKRIERNDLTAHGFRSSFRDWASEKTNFSRQVCEMALAHTITNEAEAAYRRGNLFDKRRLLMLAWSKHCDNVMHKNNVVPITRDTKRKQIGRNNRAVSKGESPRSMDSK